MKIVRIIARLNVGGPAKHVAWVTAGTRRAGHESLLVAGTVPPGEDDMGYFAAAQGVAPHVIAEMSREISPRDAVTVWKLYRLLRRERPDVVHTHTAKAGTVGRVAGLLYRWLTPAALVGRPRPVRFVHTYHGHIFHSYYGRLKTRLFLTVEQVLARLATDRIVVISPQQYREIHEQFGVGRAPQFAVVPLGLDLTAFDDWAQRREQARAAFGADADTLLVGIVGRLTEIKNHELFLQAAARCKAQLANTTRVRFVVIGDGHLRAPLTEQARALALEDDVIFTGLRDDPENFYPALDVVALTSRNEGTPLTLIEALANARAVCATAVGGVVDLLGTPAETVTDPAAPFVVCARGVRVRPGAADAFSAALVHLLDAPDLRRELGARGRAYVARHYSVERLLADLLRLYEELRPRTARAAAEDLTRARPARAKGD
ncbi:MAG TPA: glycosyltransferase [Pyrinomonadaceae bacterium]|jgi:glycosyltransferase involved in cell wall biosynthesis